MRDKIDELIRSPLFKNPKHKAVVTMVFIGNLLKTEIGELTHKYGLTIQQYNALRILRAGQIQNISMTVGDVNRRMTFKNSDVSRLLARLDKMKLVDCHTDKTDKRLLFYSPSAKGLEVLAEIDKHEDEIFRAASLLTPEETEQLNALFDKVLQAYKF